MHQKLKDTLVQGNARASFRLTVHEADIDLMTGDDDDV